MSMDALEYVRLTSALERLWCVTGRKIHWADDSLTVPQFEYGHFPPGGPRFMYRVTNSHDATDFYPYLFHYGDEYRQRGFYAVVPCAELGSGLFLYNLAGGGYESIHNEGVLSFLYEQNTAYAPDRGFLRDQEPYVVGYNLKRESGLFSRASADLYVLDYYGERVESIAAWLPAEEKTTTK